MKKYLFSSILVIIYGFQFIKTYSNPDLPVNEKLIDIVKGYIK